MKHYIFKIMTLTLIFAMMLGISACGSKSNQFEVAYVGTANIMSPDIFIAGSIDGENMNLNLAEAFKDCKVTDLAFPDEMAMGDPAVRHSFDNLFTETYNFVRL
ncbi:MAG: hypothetical protein ACOX2M_04790 [Fastidiosipilaceae bacterium]